MFKQTAERLKKLWQRCAPWVQREPENKKTVQQIYSKGASVYSPEKQKKLEKLCEQLFEQRELVTTGKLQLIGLAKIKKKLGKMWAGLQPIVYDEVEQAISKYMMPKDVFIRYKDDSYVVIFADASPQEAEIKATLIAEEIKRRLFEHEEEELRNIDVEGSVAVVRTDKLKKAGDLSETMDLIFQDIEEQKKAPKPEPAPKPKAKPQAKEKSAPFAMPKAIEVDPYADKQEAPKPDVPKATGPAIGFTYVPLWDVKKNLLTTYLCLSGRKGSESDPLDAYEEMFLGAAPSQKATLDLKTLKAVTTELASMAQEGRQLFIACPVHYDTLYRAESYEKYILECQKLPDEQKRFLIFMLLGLPSTMHEANIHKFSVPLRKHCSGLYAQVPLKTDVDFAMLRNCRFDAVGVRIKKSNLGEKKILDKLGNFTEKAKKSLVPKTFAMDVASLSITTSTVCAGYDFLSGAAIHESVEKPDSVYRFKHESLFADLLENK